jgi:hypothetical protein
MGKKTGPGSGILNEQIGSYFRELRNQFFWLKYLNYLMRIRDGKIRIRDGKTFGSGIRDGKIFGSATLVADPYSNLDSDPGLFGEHGVHIQILVTKN